MTAYILFRGIDKDTSDPMAYQRGYPVSVADDPKLHTTTKYVPPNFIEAEITDATTEQVAAYCEVWWRLIDWDWVGHDYDVDGHRLKVFAKPETVSSSGDNQLTRQQVENWLTKWRCAVVSSAYNEVVFDALVYETCCSPGFWGKDNILATVGFSELSYEPATGIHRIQANYRNDPILSEKPKDAIELHIEERGGTVTSHPTNKVVFDISRSSVFDVFKTAVKDVLDQPVFRRKFYLSGNIVDQALANDGRLTATKAQAVTYIKNRLNE